MPAWKVLIIILLACLCMGLAMATVAIPIAQESGQRWVWLACLLSATIVVGTLLVFFLRYAGASLDLKPRGNRN